MHGSKLELYRDRLLKLEDKEVFVLMNDELLDRDAIINLGLSEKAAEFLAALWEKRAEWNKQEYLEELYDEDAELEIKEDFLVHGSEIGHCPLRAVIKTIYKHAYQLDTKKRAKSLRNVKLERVQGRLMHLHAQHLAEEHGLDVEKREVFDYRDGSVVVSWDVYDPYSNNAIEIKSSWNIEALLILRTFAALTRKREQFILIYRPEGILLAKIVFNGKDLFNGHKDIIRTLTLVKAIRENDELVETVKLNTHFCNWCSFRNTCPFAFSQKKFGTAWFRFYESIELNARFFIVADAEGNSEKAFAVAKKL